MEIAFTVSRVTVELCNADKERWSSLSRAQFEINLGRAHVLRSYSIQINRHFCGCE
jgi:hypothetical protein